MFLYTACIGHMGCLDTACIGHRGCLDSACIGLWDVWTLHRPYGMF